MWDVKYRPLKFSDVLGQEGSVRLLKARLSNGTALDTSYVFSGGHGQGKTTLARILARAMLCENISKDDPEPCNQCDNCLAILNETSGAFVELDAASRGTIDNVRAIVDDLPFAVFGAAKRIYLFDEAHRMSRDSQDVLLKPLEDKRMVGIFCTTEPEKIRGTIRSRCEHYTVRKITREDILVRAKWVLDQENVAHEDDAVLTVIDFSGGHTRDILNRLEMVAQMGAVSVENVRAYLQLSAVSTYYEVLLALDNPAKAVALVEQACERVLPEDVANGLAEAAMSAYRLANGMHADFVYADRELGKQVYQKFGANTIRVAEYFLRSRFVTSISLACDILSWAQAAGQLVSVPVLLPVATAAIPQAQTTAPVSVPTEAASAPPVSTEAAATPIVPPTPTTDAVASGTPKIDVASLSSPPLTSEDPKFKPAIMPRRRNETHGGLNLSRQVQEEDEHRILSHGEWRRRFEKEWKGVFGGRAG